MVLWLASQGLNIFRQSIDPRSDSSVNSSGLDESQLVNFAAIKLDSEDDQWIFPQGQNCQVRDEIKEFNENTQCAGVTGGKDKDQEIVITDGAQLQAGVVSLGRGSTNIIRVQEGSLRAVLVEGGNELRKRVRQQRSANAETIFWERAGELIVGGIVDVEVIHQLGGTWSYAVSSTSDDFGVFPDTTASGTLLVKATELNRNINGTTSVSRATFQKIDGEGNDLSIEVAPNASLGVIDGIHGANTKLNAQGEVRLSGKSSYGGTTIIQDGATLYSENNFALSDQSPVVIDKGGLLNLQGFDNTIDSLSGDGDLLLGIEASTTDAFDDELQGADVVIQSGDFAGTIDDGGLSGIGSITKTSDRDLTLSGVNSYYSPTFVQEGRLTASPIREP